LEKPVEDLEDTETEHEKSPHGKFSGSGYFFDNGKKAGTKGLSKG
jgi:hypothetical protein